MSTVTEQGSLTSRVRSLLQEIQQQVVRNEHIQQQKDDSVDNSSGFPAHLLSTDSHQLNNATCSRVENEDKPLDIEEDEEEVDTVSLSDSLSSISDPMEVLDEDVASGTPQAAVEELGTTRDSRKALVGAFMTPNPVCLDKDMTLLDAVKVLLRHNVSGAPVVEKYEGDEEGCGRLIGVLSEEDLLWKEVEATDASISDTFREPYLWSLMAADNIMMEAVENQALKVLSNTVGLSMSEGSIAVSPDTPMGEAASIMLDAKVKRLPVVSPRPGGRPGVTVLGIISRKDMLRHVMSLLEQDGGRQSIPTETQKAA